MREATLTIFLIFGIPSGVILALDIFGFPNPAETNPWHTLFAVAVWMIGIWAVPGRLPGAIRDWFRLALIEWRKPACTVCGYRHGPSEECDLR